MKLLCKLPIRAYVTDLNNIQALKVFVSDVRIICTTKPLCADIDCIDVITVRLDKFHLISVDQRWGSFIPLFYKTVVWSLSYNLNFSFTVHSFSEQSLKCIKFPSMAILDVLLLKICSTDAGVLWDTACMFHGCSASFLGKWFKTDFRKKRWGSNWQICSGFCCCVYRVAWTQWSYSGFIVMKPRVGFGSLGLIFIQ